MYLKTNIYFNGISYVTWTPLCHRSDPLILIPYPKRSPGSSLSYYFRYSLPQFLLTHLGGLSTSSRNSSILLTSVFTSPLKVMNGGWVPGARFCRSAGFLEQNRRNKKKLQKHIRTAEHNAEIRLILCMYCGRPLFVWTRFRITVWAGSFRQHYDCFNRTISTAIVVFY